MNETTNTDLLREITAMRAELQEHIATETPLLTNAVVALDALGNIEVIRVRVAFINMLIERENDRKVLRKAIIEKTVVGAVWAVLIYTVFAIGHDIRDIVKGWVKP
jgi:hypothetical protein